MGVSVLSRYFRNEYQRIVGIVRETDLNFVEAEESVLGVTHADVGGWLAERWILPDHLVEAVSLHHAPANAARNPDLVALIHCGDVFACRIMGTAEFDKGVEFDHDALNRLQLNDAARREEYMASYSSLVQAELAQLTRGGDGQDRRDA